MAASFQSYFIGVLQAAETSADAPMPMTDIERVELLQKTYQKQKGKRK